MTEKKQIFLLIIVSILWICKPIPYQEVASYKYSRQQTVISSKDGRNTRSTEVDFVDEKGFISKDGTSFRKDGYASPFPSDPSKTDLGLTILVGSKKDRNVSQRNIKLQKKIFKKYFPDWTERVEYQNRQLEFLQSSQKKLRQADRLRLNEKFKSKMLTQDEKDALNYFDGTGFYQYHQDLNTPPNIYDTRQTFLDKMQNSEM